MAAYWSRDASIGKARWLPAIIGLVPRPIRLKKRAHRAFTCPHPLPCPNMPLQNLVLIGFMGTGKSSIGRLLARKLGFEFVDTDRLVIERAGMEISTIFAQFGEGHFRELETEVLQS